PGRQKQRHSDWILSLLWLSSGGTKKHPSLARILFLLLPSWQHIDCLLKTLTLLRDLDRESTWRKDLEDLQFKVYQYMMDPISVSASILGLLGAAAKISEVLTSFVKGVKDAPGLAQRTLTEVEDLKLCFHQLQDFVNQDGSRTRTRTSMIMVHQLVVILTHSIITFSELETAVEGLKPRSSFIMNSRFRWMAKEHTITLLLQRLQASKISLNLLMTTLTCAGIEEAQEAMQSLTTAVNDVLDTNQRICRRLENSDFSIQQKHRSAPPALESKISESDASIEKTRRETWTSSIATAVDANPDYDFAFEKDLRASRVYSRVIRTLAQRTSPRLPLSNGKIALLGISNAGKSTILKQLRSMEGMKPTRAELVDASDMIYTHLMDNVEKILWPDDIDNPFDASLYVYVRTIGLYKSNIRMKLFEYEMIDVGGSRVMRKKWLHCMKGLDYVIYVADLNGYCQNLEEDPNMNQMLESLLAFEDITASPHVRSTPIFLFLNKADLFERNIVHHPISKAFPDYTGGVDYWKACRYMAESFVRRDQRPPGKLHCYVVDSLDTTAFQNAWQKVQEKIIHTTLKY
ncbi:MAG: hypothetical protein Q9224_005258, partial [Gallowayella concinna]